MGQMAYGRFRTPAGFRVSLLILQVDTLDSIRAV